MASNTLSPNGLSFASNLLIGANTYKATKYKIKNGYGSNIGRGDVVMTGTGGNQGYVILGTSGASNWLGVFVGILPYYDTTLQAIGHGLNGSYQSGLTPPSGVDIDCLVIDDPFAVFMAQMNASSWAVSWRGQNVNFLSGSNGAPDKSGQSTLSLDSTTIATTNTLPLRIVDVAGVTGGPQDPANVNPWVLVKLNTSEILAATGI